MRCVPQSWRIVAIALRKSKNRCRIRIMEIFLDILAYFAGIALVWGCYYGCLKLVDMRGWWHG